MRLVMGRWGRGTSGHVGRIRARLGVYEKKPPSPDRLLTGEGGLHLRCLSGWSHEACCVFLGRGRRYLRTTLMRCWMWLPLSISSTMAMA